VKGKTRSRKPPLRLSAAEVAKIDQLIEDHRGRYGTDEQREQERQHRLRHDEEELQRLVQRSPETPWPKQVGPGPTSGRDGFLYVREEEERLQLAHVVEVARRDGVVRYALAPGDPEIDLDRHWERRDPSWQFVMDRLKGVKPDDVDRVTDEVIDELFDSDILLSRNTKQFIKEDRHERADPKRRQRNRDRALAIVISGQVSWLENLLRAWNFTAAKTRAEEYLARQWRETVKQDRRSSRFSSGPALNAWVRWALKRAREKPR
jgi:hypothetical protein